MSNIKRGITSDEIFKKEWSGEISYFLYGVLPKDLLPTDKIFLNINESYEGKDNGWDAYSELIVTRDRPQTDEEWEASKKFWNEKMEESKSERKKLYLKLKAEFEKDI